MPISPERALLLGGKRVFELPETPVAEVTIEERSLGSSTLLNLCATMQPEPVTSSDGDTPGK